MMSIRMNKKYHQLLLYYLFVYIYPIKRNINKSCNIKPALLQDLQKSSNLADMKKIDSIQEILFQSIKTKLPPNISFVHNLSELLGISYDSAYRRIRGEKELSLLMNIKTSSLLWNPTNISMR